MLIIITLLLCLSSGAQNGFLIVKKKNRPVLYFGKGSRLTFQTSDGQWITGFLEKIDKDSFSFSQQIIRYYTIGADTLNFRGMRFGLEDISALPSERQHFAWVRNGFIFQLAGGGYAGLNIINDLYRKDPPFSKNNLPSLGISAATFLLGTLLHIKYDPYIRPGRKYKFELVEI